MTELSKTDCPKFIPNPRHLPVPRKLMLKLHKKYYIRVQCMYCLFNFPSLSYKKDNLSRKL